MKKAVIAVSFFSLCWLSLFAIVMSINACCHNQDVVKEEKKAEPIKVELKADDKAQPAPEAKQEPSEPKDPEAKPDAQPPEEKPAEAKEPAQEAKPEAEPKEHARTIEVKPTADRLGKLDLIFTNKRS